MHTEGWSEKWSDKGSEKTRRKRLRKKEGNENERTLCSGIDECYIRLARKKDSRTRWAVRKSARNQRGN